MPDDKVQFRPGPLAALLNERDQHGNISEVARRDLDRYYSLLALALTQAELTEGEAGLIVDAMNGTLIDINAAQALHWEIEDALQDGLAEKWAVDGVALLTKLRQMGLLQRLAICDAVERFWHDAYHVENTHARLVRVGLVRSGI